MAKQTTPGYRTEQIIETQIAGRDLRLGTRAGFAAWGHIPQAMELVAQHAKVNVGERVLVWPCGHGALAVWAAWQTPADHVTALDTHVVAVEAAKRATSLNRCRAVRTLSALPSATGTVYDVVLMTQPRARDVLRLLLLEAWGVLREGGRLYLAGANEMGIKNAINDAEALCGPGQLLAYKGGNRVVCFTRGPLPVELPEVYRAPGVPTGTYRRYEVQVGAAQLAVCSRPGVFSWRELDHGTRLLLDSLQVRVTDRVLDAACGTGLAGLLAQRGASKGRVTWLDPELLAVESTRATLAANGASGTVLQGDAVDAAAGEGPFTLILGSPGQRGGWAVNDEVAEALAEEAYAALEPRGRFVLVTNRFVSYQRAIEARFGAVVTLAENKGYRVLSAEKAFVRKVRGRPTRRQRQAADEETVYQID